MLTTVLWDGGPSGTGTNWHDEVNWQGDHLPGSDDDAVIDVAADPTISITAPVTVRSLTCAEAMSLGSSLSVSQASRIDRGLALSGTLTGAGSVTLGGISTWLGGSMTGTGSTVVSPGASLTVSAGVTLDTRPLLNHGTLTWQAGHWAVHSATITNAVDGTFNLTSAGGMSSNNNTGAIVNDGVVNKIGATLTQFTNGSTRVPLVNHNTVHVLEGTLLLHAGMNSATLTADMGTRLDFASGFGNFDFADGALLSGAGRIGVANTLVITGTTIFSGSNLVLEYSGANLSGGGTFRNTGAATWAAGSMTGMGATEVAPGGAMGVTADVTLDTRSLVNHGTLTWQTGQWSVHSATITNAADGIFNLVSTGGMSSNDNSGTIVNDGALNKLGAGLTQFTNGSTRVLLLNHNMVHVVEGTLRLHTGTNFATFIADAGTRLDFTAGLGGFGFGDGASASGAGRIGVANTLFTTGAATLSGPNVVLEYTGSNLDGSGTFMLTGTTTWVAGSMTGTGVTVIPSSASLTVMADVTLDTRALVNHGTLTWQAGQWSVHSATITNAADGTFNLVSTTGMASNNNSGTIVNDGVLNKIGAGLTQLTNGSTRVLLLNHNMVHVVEGTLRLHTGTNFATFIADAGTRLDFAAGLGNFGFGDGASASGAGRIGVANTLFTTGIATLSGPNVVLEYTGSNLDGSGTFMLIGSTTWTAGSMTGAGVTVIPSSALFTVMADVTLDTRSLVNHGTLAWQAGQWSVHSATITNAADGTFNLVSTAMASNNNSGTIVNDGVLNKIGAGVTQFTNGSTRVLLLNHNMVHVVEGTLRLHTGTNFATFIADAGTRLDFAAGLGNFGFGDGASVSGAGRIGVANTLFTTGTATLSGPNVVLEYTGSNLDGSGTFRITGAAAWEAGAMTGNGATEVAPGGALTVAANVTLDTRSLVNHGTLTWQAGQWSVHSAAITNAADGIFNLVSAGGMSSNNNSGTIVNDGTVNKTGLTTTILTNGSTFVALTNRRAVNVLGGVLQLHRGTNAGVMRVTQPAQLLFPSGFTHAEGSTVAGSGMVTFNGEHTLSGSSSFDAASMMFAGGISGPGGLRITGTMSWTGGIMSGPGSTTIGRGGTLRILGAVQSNGRNIINQGALTWSAGTWTLQGGAVVATEVGSVFSISGTTDLVGINAGGSLSNAGTMSRATGGVTRIFVPSSNTGSLVMLAGTTRFQGSLDNSGIIRVFAGTLDLPAGASLSGSAGLFADPGSQIVLGGDLVTTTTNADLFLPLGTTRYITGVRTLEVMGRELGNTAPGYDRNFTFGRIELVGGTTLRLVDLIDNSPGSGAEALYVNTLVVPAGAVLDLSNGGAPVHVYARASQILGSVVGGTVSIVSDSGEIFFGIPAPGVVVSEGEIDEWTFFGRAGRSLSAIVDPGFTLPPPVALGWCEMQVVGPDGQVLPGGVANNVAEGPGTLVRLLALPLPVDGIYRIRVLAPEGHTESTGRYELVAYNSTLDVSALALGQQVAGAIESPYSIDRWTFSATVNQQVSFDLLGVESPTLLFSLTGPGGAVVFSDINTNSGLVNLPASGGYVLTARGAGTTTGAYSFRLTQTTQIDLSPGVPYAGVLPGSGTAQLFRVTLDRAKPFRLEFADSSDADVNAVYLRRGAPPTRADYDQRADTGADAVMVSPVAVAGDWYVLVYSDYVPAPSAFTIRADASDVLVLHTTPDRYGAQDGAQLTLTGAGFVPGVAVALVDPGDPNHTLDATSVEIDSFTQATATFDLTGAAKLRYDLRVTHPGSGESHTLPGALDVIASGQAQLETRLIMPGSLGRHALGTIYVEYANIGTAAMDAPVLLLQSSDADGSTRPILTLDQSRLTEGLWTSGLPDGFSTSIQIFAGGSTPGKLNPGDRVTVPVYYAGLLQPWVDSQVAMEIRIFDAANEALIDWDEIGDGLRPPGMGDEAWGAVFGNLRANVGDTWGGYVSRLQENAEYLGRLGTRTSDVSELWGFEMQQAIGLNTMDSLVQAVDASMRAPGLNLVFSRDYKASLPSRFEIGPMGRGWYVPWMARAEMDASNGSVSIMENGQVTRRFQRDLRTLSGYFSAPGDLGVLAQIPGGGMLITGVDGGMTGFLADGRLSFIGDANGNRITLSYEGDRLVTLTHSSGQMISLTYNSGGRVASVQDSTGRRTDLEYDTTGEYLISATRVTGVTRYTYATGAAGAGRHALLSIEENGVGQSFSYDEQGRQVSHVFSDGSAGGDLAYPGQGEIVFADALGNTTRVFQDHLGRLVREVDALGNISTLDYDTAGRVTRVVNAEGRARSFTWCDCGNLTSETDEMGRTTRYTLDPVLRVRTSMTDAHGNTTLYAHDSRGNLITTTYADGTIERSTIGARGLYFVLYQQTGHTFNYEYNVAGQVTSEQVSDGTFVSRAYDTFGNLISVTDSSGTSIIEYDVASHPTRVTYPNGRFVAYAYDAQGWRTTMADQSGAVVRYRYDAVGRPLGISDTSGVPVVDYAYDANGSLVHSRDAAGSTTDYTLDTLGRLAALVNRSPGGTVTSRFAYTFDTLGRATALETLDGAWRFAYDDSGQLVHAELTSLNPQIADQDLTYEYDAVGNRIRSIENGLVTDYTTDRMNRYVQIGADSLSYDASGNLVSQTGPSGTTAYAYNVNDRLVRTTSAFGTQIDEYFADGPRVASIVNGERIEYLVDPTGLGNVIATFDAQGVLTARYIHAAGLVAREESPGQRRYYQFDAVGSTVTMTSDFGTVTSRHAYDPHGRTLMNSGDTETPFLFCGRAGVMNDGNGLFYMRARRYDASAARFTSEDPLGIGAGSPNFYRYADNTPTMASDPSGLLTLREALPCIARRGGATNFLESDHPLVLRGQAVGGWYDPSDDTIVLDRTQKNYECICRHEESHREQERRRNPPSCEQSEIQAREVGAQCYFEYKDYINYANDKAWIDDIKKNGYPGCKPGSGPKPAALHPPHPEPGGAGGAGASGAPASVDPNHLLGPGGFGPQHFVSRDASLGYRVEFENYGPGSINPDGSPVSSDRWATAPAQQVVITSTLDSSFDLSAFELRSFGFGDTLIAIPSGLQHFQTIVSITYLGRSFDVWFEAGLEIAENGGATRGTLFARFQSIDPLTNLPPDVLTGFLPPEDGTGIGKGFFEYTIRALPAVATGTEIRSIALISFDNQTVIATNQIDPLHPEMGTDPEREALVTIDAGVPNAGVLALPDRSGARNFLVRWVGADDANGSGIESYTIYVSIDGGEYAPWLVGTPLTEATYEGMWGRTYSFIALARDHVGNTEVLVASGEAMTTVGLPGITYFDNDAGDGDWHNPINWSSDQLPGPGADVVIDVEGHPTVTFSMGALTLSSVVSFSHLVVSGGLLAITGDSNMFAGLTISGGMLALSANILVRGNVLNSGILSLTAAATLAIDGTYTQTTSGTLRTKVAGTLVGSFGRVVATGVVQLDGTLSVSFVDGYAQERGDSFDLVSGAGLSGSFATLNLPPEQGNVKPIVLYTPLGARLFVTSRADVNNDGIINSQDFFDFLIGFFDHTTDFNGDGTVNSQDFFDFLDLFFRG